MEAERSIPEQEGAQQHAHRRIPGKGGHGNAVPAVPGEKPMTKRLYTARHWMDRPGAAGRR